MKKIEIVKPTIKDLDTVVQIEKSAWPDIGEGMVAEYEKFENRLKLGLMYLLYFENQPAGIISFQKPSFTNSEVLHEIVKEYESDHSEIKSNNCWSEDLLEWDKLVAKYELPKNWYEATNNGYIINGSNSTHDPNSDCLFLIGVGVNQSLKGKGLVNHLINHTVLEAKKECLKAIVGYGRLPQFHEKITHGGILAAQNHLLEKKQGTDLPADYGARFHVFNGAKAVSVIPEAMKDPESINYGFLAIYDLQT
jgi:hypothetical protein